MSASAHEQWTAAWEEAAEVRDKALRDMLHRRLSTVSGELSIGRQADPKRRRASLAVIRQVRQLAGGSEEAGGE